MKLKNISKKTPILALTFLLLGTSLGVGATSLIYSKDVSYDNSKSGLSSNTVQGALDELYEKAKNAPSCDSDGVCTVSCPEGKTFEATSSGYKCKSVPASDTLINGGIATSGDGLYADSTEKGRYIYRGSNPNNYITFNNETWRIISIESDGSLKIVRSQQLSSTYKWDAQGNRSSSTSTYCTSSYGCNAWAATSNLVDSPSTITYYYPNGNTSDSTNYTGTVTSDSTMATYLNGTYYNSLSTTAKAKVVKGTFNVSPPGYYTDTESLETDAMQEKQYQWKGYVALYTVTELLRASTNSSCTSLNKGYSSGNCNTNNWLWPTFNNSNYEWTLSPCVASDRSYVWRVYTRGDVYSDNAYGSSGVRPVLNLTSNISLGGSGISSNHYTIN